MKVKQTDDQRLVLTANRRLIGVINLAASPLVVWLGLLVVSDGGTAWFGYAFAALGVLMAALGIAVCFSQTSLVLDRQVGTIRHTIRGPFRRRHWIMSLEDLDHAKLREFEIDGQLFKEIVFVPKPGTSAKPLRIKEFLTLTAADDAFSAIRMWLPPEMADTAP